MSFGLWNVNNFPATATAASASKSAPVTDTGVVVRGKVINFSASGSNAAPTGILQAVVRDGATGSGTIIWTGTLQAPANGSTFLNVPETDLRASVGNALTAEFTSAPAAGCQCAVSMQGDLVSTGYPPFSNRNAT